MAITRTSSVSSDTSLTTTTTISDGSSTQSSSLLAVDEADLTVSSTHSEPDESDSLAIVVGGDATAIGENTLATGIVSAEIDATGGTTAATGSATFSATGQSEGDETAYASSYSIADAYGGETIVKLNYTTTSIYQTEEQTSWSETSTSAVSAVDVDSTQVFIDDTSGSLTETLDSDGLDGSSSSDGQSYPEADQDLTIDGNLAYFEVDALALGDDTYLSLDATAIVVEDQMSTVSIFLAGGAG